ncbi:MAG: TolC family outer membrane protein [Gammaproteobacteria bacterium]|nr:TolC family outer membrane protein [Gammaproteobacteria bacterium]
MSKRHLPLSLLLGTLSLWSSLGHTENLQEIYTLALDNDHQLKADTANYRAGLENLTISRARLLPQINGSASYSETDYDFSGRQSNQAFNDARGDVHSETYSVTLTQPLLNMAAWFGYKQGISLSALAEAQFSADQQSLIIRVAEAYFNVLRAVDNMETALAEEKALSHQLEQTNQRFEVGLTAITDVHEAQAAFDSANAATLQAQGALGIAFEELEVLTGRSHAMVAPLVDTFPVSKPQPTDRHQWVEFALQNNYLLKVAELNSAAAKQNARAKASGHLPTLTASLQYVDYDDTNSDITSSSGSISDNDSRFTDQSTIAVQLDVPIFSGLGVSGERRQAQQQKIQAQEQYQKTQRDIIQGARSLHLSVVTNVAQVNALNQAIRSSQSALEATQAGYDVGTRNLVDVLVAQRNLYQAQRAYDESRYNYVLDMLRLKEVAGNLTPADLLQLNQWLDDGAPVLRAKYE